jgi:hypothetical protein
MEGRKNPRRPNSRKRKARRAKPVGEHEAAVRILKEQAPILHHLAVNEPHALGSGLEILSKGIGLPWIEVRQQLQLALAGSSLEEFLDELCVELDPVFIEGVPHSKRSDGTLMGPCGWGMNLYVDPDSGLLLNWQIV